MSKEAKSGAGIDSAERDALPRSIFVPREDPRKDLRETVDSILSDRFMAFLSIVLIPVIVLPLFFSFSAQVLSFFDICDVTIILFFVIEYAAKLYLAKSRWEYFKSPWHLLDLAVILLSFVSYVPFLGLRGKGSTTLLLRLLRLPRALAVGGRTAGSRMKSKEIVQATEEKAPVTVIRLVGADMAVRNENMTWEDVERHLATNEEEWIDIHNITEEGMLRLAGMLRVVPRRFKPTQIDELSPHIEYAQQMSFIFLQSGQIRYPELPESYLTISKLGEVIICKGPKIVSASPHGVDIFKQSLEDMRSHAGEHRFAISVLYGMLDSSLRGYRSIFSEIETEITKIGNTPKAKLPKDFLQRTYELNKEVVRMVSNLVHFKELLGVAISKRVPLEGFDESAEEDFQSLQEEAAYLNDVADDIVDHLRTIIDLYINQSSYETNRILRILAVITSLAVIPSAIGGILGMNLLDVPYQFELWQIVLAIAISMAFVGYCFTKLGWLKA